MAAKDKMFTIRIPEKLLEEYKQFCDENAMNVSKRIRKFMERDVEVWKLKKIAKNNSGN
jgi:predicted DNA binding CopG/RHH family protein